MRDLAGAVRRGLQTPFIVAVLPVGGHSLPDVESITSVRNAGFEGFLTVEELRRSRCAEVPDLPGIYLILRPSGASPRFLALSPAGHFKGRDPTVSEATLAENWVASTAVIYIGKAGSRSGKTTLRRRLRSYMRSGAGYRAAHWGGRFIWQLADSERLLVCWRATPDEEPREVERRLLAEFREVYGRRPFANLTG